MKRSSLVLLMASIFVMMMSSFTFAGWVKDGDFYKYEENGTFKTKEWFVVDGNQYYFDENSHMATGLQKIGKNYHAFHTNGTPYKKTENFTFDVYEFEIGAKGKVIDLENHMSDEDYNAYLAEKALEAENNKAFLEHQKTVNESLEAVRKEQEALRQAENALLESQRAIENESKALAEAAAREAEKARQEYLLSDANEQLINQAANRGSNTKKIVENTINEMKSQLNIRKLELIQKAKDLRTANPMAELGPIIEDYSSIVNAYANKADGILDLAEYKYGLSEKKREEYVNQFVSVFENMKESFETMLDKSVG